MKSFSLREFRPTLFFLGKFIALYVVLNLLYGAYITAHKPGPDPVTRVVTDQTGIVLNMFGVPVKTTDHESRSTTLIWHKEKVILAVYEGCNGVNTMIVFISFLIAFGPLSRSLLWFLPLGLFLIHLVNLLRVSTLFWVAESYPRALYFVHKYVFTAVLYVFIFLLWLWWIKKITSPRR